VAVDVPAPGKTDSEHLDAVRKEPGRVASGRGVTFAYDRRGRQKTVTDALGERSFDYNADTLQLAGETLPDSTVIARTYDTLGRPEKLLIGDPSNPSYRSDYGYAANGRFASVTANVGGAQHTAGYTYAADSDLVSGYQIGSLIRAVTYEPNRDLVDVVENTFNQTVLSKFDYTNDTVGRRTGRADTGDAFASQQANAFGYNARSEVESADMRNGQSEYEYDPIGNRREVTLPEEPNPLTYVANALNQYTAITGRTNPIHDDDGNMLDDGAGLAMTWDGENRLIRTVKNNQTVTYAYDYMSRRVAKTVGNTTWKYIYDGWNLIREEQIVNQTSDIRHFIWGLDLSQTFQGAGGVGGLLLVYDGRANPPGEPYAPTYDANGNISEYIRLSDGNVTAHLEYDAFGRVIASTGTAPAAFGFSTKYTDSETGLVYYGYRYYSPELGRWLSRDPIGEAGGENAYLAFYNDPVGLIDPDGLSPVFVTTERGQEREVQSIRDIAIKRETGLGGLFEDRIQWVIANPPSSIEEALADTSPLVVCDFKFSLQITVRSGSAIRSGQTYFYVPHVRGNDGRATGNGPFDAAKAHEMGHAHAYWVDVRPCAERIHARWGGRALSEQEQRQVEREYEACKTDQYWLDSGRYANEWERNYYDVTARGQFRRTFPSDPRRIGQVTQPVNYGGNSYNATDLWVAR